MDVTNFGHAQMKVKGKNRRKGEERRERGAIRKIITFRNSCDVMKLADVNLFQADDSFLDFFSLFTHVTHFSIDLLRGTIPMQISRSLETSYCLKSPFYAVKKSMHLVVNKQPYS